MTEITLKAPLTTILGYLEKEVGERKFWLHNQIGGIGWTVNLNNGFLVINIEDKRIATYLVLKFKKQSKYA